MCSPGRKLRVIIFTRCRSRSSKTASLNKRWAARLCSAAALSLGIASVSFWTPCSKL